jgi:transposase
MAEQYITGDLRRGACKTNHAARFRAFHCLTESAGFPFDVVCDSRCWLEGGQHLMTRALSNDLRERVVAAVGAGESSRSVAARFGVAVSSVVKWSQRYRTTGSVAPAKMGGHRKRILEPHRAFIVERINETSNLTLHRLKDELAVRGVRVSHNAVWQFLRREGLSKKKRCSPLSKAGPTSPDGAGAGSPGRAASIPLASSSSTRPG